MGRVDIGQPVVIRSIDEDEIFIIVTNTPSKGEEVGNLTDNQPIKERRIELPKWIATTNVTLPAKFSAYKHFLEMEENTPPLIVGAQPPRRQGITQPPRQPPRPGTGLVCKKSGLTQEYIT